MHTAGEGTEYEGATGRFGDTLRTYWADLAICFSFLLFGLIAGLATCRFAPMPEFWTQVPPQLYCLAVIFAGIRFGLGLGLISAAVASAAALAATTVCALSDSRLSLPVMLFAVGLVSGWIGKRSAVAAATNNETIRRKGQEWNRGASISELGRLMPQVVDQFRTPIASIQGAGFVLEDPELPPERREEFVAILRKECQHLQLLVELLDFTHSRWSADGEADVHRLFEEVIAQCVSSAGSRVTLKNLASGNSPRLLCQQELMKHALVTLVTEAIRAMPGPGEVALSIQASQGETLLRVEANVGDMPAQAALAHAFAQSDLSIVRKVIERHAGALRIEQSTESGVSVCIILPQKRSTRR